VRDLDDLDVEEIAMALADQTDGEHAWLIDPVTGQIVFWTSESGIDGETRVDLDDLEHLILIEPLAPSIWYRDMVDFVNGITDDRAGGRLGRALEGRGAFRRFKDELYRDFPELIAVWHAFRDTRAEGRAVQRLADQDIVSEDAAQAFLAEHRDPDLP